MTEAMAMCCTECLRAMPGGRVLHIGGVRPGR